MFVVGVVVVASFAVASVALSLTLSERDTRIMENEKAIAAGARRSARNCERIRVIVQLLDQLTPSVPLTIKLAQIDARYPDVSPCPTPNE